MKYFIFWGWRLVRSINVLCKIAEILVLLRLAHIFISVFKINKPLKWFNSSCRTIKSTFSYKEATLLYNSIKRKLTSAENIWTTFSPPFLRMITGLLCIKTGLVWKCCQWYFGQTQYVSLTFRRYLSTISRPQEVHTGFPCTQTSVGTADEEDEEREDGE